MNTQPTRVMHRVLWAVLLGAAPGCQGPRPEWIDRQLVAEVMTGSRLSANLRALAMPGGRLSGSTNGRRAEDFVADRLREYGLSNVHFEPFDMVTWQDRLTRVTVPDDPPWELDPVQALGNCTSTPPEGITGELVDVGKGTPDEFKAKVDLLPGRFALAHYGEAHRSEVMKLALEHGAIGLLHISHLDDHVVVGTCHKQPSPAPGVAVSGHDGQKLAERLAAGQTVTVNVRVEADTWHARPRNVVGEIPGVGPNAEQLVVVCAHLDSWHLAEGALDNGTGSTAVLEAARVLAKVRPRPRRTVRFIWFMGEEHGLFGSEAYVAAHQDELDRIIVVLNNDMPGEPRAFVTFGHPEVVEFLRGVSAALPGYEVDDKIGESIHTFSDHAPFMKQGVCAVSISGELGPGVKFYHTTGDTFDQVDRRGLHGCAAVLAVLARRFADCPDVPTERLDPEWLRQRCGW